MEPSNESTPRDSETADDQQEEPSIKFRKSIRRNSIADQLLRRRRRSHLYDDIEEQAPNKSWLPNPTRLPAPVGWRPPARGEAGGVTRRAGGVTQRAGGRGVDGSLGRGMLTSRMVHNPLASDGTAGSQTRAAAAPSEETTSRRRLPRRQLIAAPTRGNSGEQIERPPSRRNLKTVRQESSQDRVLAGHLQGSLTPSVSEEPPDERTPSNTASPSAPGTIAQAPELAAFDDEDEDRAAIRFVDCRPSATDRVSRRGSVGQSEAFCRARAMNPQALQSARRASLRQDRGLAGLQACTSTLSIETAGCGDVEMASSTSIGEIFEDGIGREFDA